MKLPSRKTCFALIHEMGMMDHIIHHSVMVSQVARFLGNCLLKTYPALDIRLTERSALLHDITKTRSFVTGEMHSETGKILLEEMGFPEVANIIRQHVILDHYSMNDPVTEIEIVNYSDKRILHDQIVSLDERLEYILNKYGKNKDYSNRIHIMWENTILLEEKLFKTLDFEPDSLVRVMPEVIKPFSSNSV
jgi:putative nucleotidyltransferase with HDIG domain